MSIFVVYFVWPDYSSSIVSKSVGSYIFGGGRSFIKGSIYKVSALSCLSKKLSRRSWLLSPSELMIPPFNWVLYGCYGASVSEACSSASSEMGALKASKKVF